MVSIPSLWLPILLSAVAVFVASSVIHMFLGYHAVDYARVPAEDDVMATLRKFDLPPGDYMLPCPGSAAAMKDPAFLEKLKAGPRVMMTVMPGGEITMGPQFIQWFLFSVLIGITAAYISGRALGYSLAAWPMSIWYKRSWGTTLRLSLDGLIYALLTGGFFGWLWPR
jgi:hypothetical protein